MSIPSCMRPQRIPNPLTTGPLTGQIRPAADGAPVPLEPAPVCAVRIAAASAALCAARASTSARYSSRDFRASEIALSFRWRAAVSVSLPAASRSRTARASAVLAVMTETTAAVSVRVRTVARRSSAAFVLAASTSRAMRWSCAPMRFTNS